MATQIGPSGLTKAWRGHDGSRCLTFREACHRGLTFTIMLRGWRVKFFYIALGFGGHWLRWHKPGSHI